jgi:hypothetical protein
VKSVEHTDKEADDASELILVPIKHNVYVLRDQDVNHKSWEVEYCKGELVLRTGLDSKHWFESFWGKVKFQGQLIKFNGPIRRIHFIDHIEYIGHYAKDDCLEKLRKVLRLMRDSGINTSETFIDNTIATRTAKRRQSAVIVLDFDDEEEDVADTANLEPEDFEGRAPVTRCKRQSASRREVV